MDQYQNNQPNQKNDQASKPVIADDKSEKNKPSDISATTPVDVTKSSNA